MLGWLEGDWLKVTAFAACVGILTLPLSGWQPLGISSADVPRDPVELPGGPQVLAQRGEDDGEIPDEMIVQFARVVLAIEPFRLKALEETNGTTDRTRQNEIRRAFLRQAATAIEIHDMSIPDYNKIAIQLRDDTELRARVEDAIRMLQQEEIEGQSSRSEG